MVDNSGKPIAGLAAADFSVAIDGKASPVDTVEWVPAQADRRVEGLSSTLPITTAPRRGRWIVFLFQRNPNLSDVQGLMRVRTDLATFANTFAEEDRVAILSFDTNLHYWLDFTNDIGRIQRVMRHEIFVESAQGAETGPFPSLGARLSPETARSTYTIEKALRLLGEALDPLPGAKTIIVLGYGMGTWSPREGLVQMEHDYADTFFSLQKARVSVFCIDITKADYHPRQEGLRMVAEDTGGFYMQSHIFSAAVFDRLAGALAGYYVLLVVPPDVQKGERQIDVRLVRRKGTVIAKRAYIAE